MERYLTVDQGLSETISNDREGRGGRIVFDERGRKGGRESDFFAEEATRDFFWDAKESNRVVWGPTQSRGRVRFQSDKIRFVKRSKSETTER